MNLLDRLFGNPKTFKPPEGINFKTPEIELNELAKICDLMLNFIQTTYDDKQFWLYDDWWEFDGTHFPRKKITLNDLKEILNSSKNLFENRRSDFLVYTGISPTSYSWYLRYNIEATNEVNPLCTLDITIPYVDVERFNEIVIDKISSFRLHQADAIDYYKSIIKESVTK